MEKTEKPIVETDVAPENSIIDKTQETMPSASNTEAGSVENIVTTAVNAIADRLCMALESISGTQSKLHNELIDCVTLLGEQLKNQNTPKNCDSEQLDGVPNFLSDVRRDIWD